MPLPLPIRAALFAASVGLAVALRAAAAAAATAKGPRASSGGSSGAGAGGSSGGGGGGGGGGGAGTGSAPGASTGTGTSAGAGASTGQGGTAQAPPPPLSQAEKKLAALRAASTAAASVDGASESAALDLLLAHAKALMKATHRAAHDHPVGGKNDKPRRVSILTSGFGERRLPDGARPMARHAGPAPGTGLPSRARTRESASRGGARAQAARGVCARRADGQQCASARAALQPNRATGVGARGLGEAGFYQDLAPHESARARSSEARAK
jgi:hypothetical protein